MRRVWVMGCLLSLVLAACQKEVVPAYAQEKLHEVDLPVKPMFLKPRLPDTMRVPDDPIWPTIPRLSRIPRDFLPIGFPLSQCVASYDDLVAVLGSSKAQANAVVLYGPSGDIQLERSVDLPGIWYTAVQEVTGSSLFRSQLQVEWRPDPSVYCSGFTADVWSAGCVYEKAVVGPFTNILKGGVEILINTIFFWGVGDYAGYRIKYLVMD